jgi:hypothetical protein
MVIFVVPLQGGFCGGMISTGRRALCYTIFAFQAKGDDEAISKKS